MSTSEISAASAGEASKAATIKFNYNYKDAILYALSIGVSTNNEKNLKFLYENHSEFSIFPMYAVMPAFSILFSSVQSFLQNIQLKIDPSKVLHGEHYLELFTPLKPEDNLEVRASLVDVLDKGSGASMVINVELFNDKKERVALNQFVTFFPGDGNFGGKRDSDKMIKVSTKKFDRKADRTVEERTSSDQAAVYRLNGDFNPLHIDPSFSSMLGFDKPILHGLCTFGYAVKHVLNAYCDDDVTLFKSVKVRFVKPVLPGQTIQTNMWLEKESNRVYFECRVLETQSVVISGAYVTLHAIKSAPDSVGSIKETTPSSENFAADKIFNEIGIKLKENPDIAKSIKSVYLFQISRGDATKVYSKIRRE
jgi:3-hydroxyacyl-CoA dehydrogenase/3a,7a,12a-trihydroxy-5b-cholest-24-enoyl-CoA hydratase